MKNILKTMGLAASCLLAGTALQSCALDEPFKADGEGVLQMKLVINSDVTRAESDIDALSENCVVYISSAKGLIHKYQGLENLPESVTLKSGHYVAEAWTGDSVTASFDKKFFRGYQPFDITTGATPVVVNCKIANVVVSVNPATIDTSLMKDFNIKVENSRGSLDFTAENYDYAKGYFMMPNDDTTLNVTIIGTNSEGREFSKSMAIENVERAHEYVLNLAYNPSYAEEGGSFVTITVDDSEVLIEGEVEIFSAPRISGVTSDIDKQILGNAGAFKEQIVRVKAFGGITKMLLSSDDYAAFGLPESRIDLKSCTAEMADAVKAAGFTWDETYNEAKNLTTCFITLTAAMLNKIPERNTEYVLTLEVTDKYGKAVAQNIRLAVGEGAIVIDDPITLEPIDQTKDLMAVLTTRATVTGTLVAPDAANPGIRYRVAGSSDDWTFVALDAATVQAVSKRKGMSAARILRAPGKTFSITLTGLQPGTRYEYQAVADGFASESAFFTTEGKFTIPNASMETWGTYQASTMLGKKTVVFPGADRNDYFWDSGNEGAATASKQVLFESTDMAHSGSKSAKLASSAALGIIAAGNMFAGEYVKTDGTDGVLSLGREYDGSHPSKVRVYANYRPGGSVTIKNGNDKYVDVVKGGTDQGQIYIALTTAPIEVRTKESNRKLFPAGPTNEDGKPSEDYDKVVAYGQVTWSEAFGPDGGLQLLDIPFEYKSNASTLKPKYLVIVASATKFGDFYCGSSSSVMYLDDFELVYE